MRFAVTSDATGRVVKFGDLDFAAAGDVGPGQTQVAVVGEDFPDLQAAPLHHYKVVGGFFAVQAVVEQNASDAELAAEERAQAKGALVINRVVATTADLPLPPPSSGLFVGVQDGGAGVVALAISGGARWFIFDSDRIVGP